MAKQGETFDGWDVEDVPGGVRLTKDGRELTTTFNADDLTRDEAIRRSVLTVAVNDYEAAAGKKFDAEDRDVPAELVDAFDEIIAVRERSRSMGRRRLAAMSAAKEE